jgi:hypothetical protein
MFLLSTIKSGRRVATSPMTFSVLTLLVVSLAVFWVVVVLSTLDFGGSQQPGIGIPSFLKNGIAK